MIYDKPITLNTLKLKNRYIMAPVKTAYGTPKGDVTNRHLIYYENMAKGGVALIILEPVSVSQSGKEHPKQLTIHLDDSVENLKKITDVIHKNGSLACLNINHAGRAALPKATGMNPKAPSAVMCPTTGATPDVLNKDEIEEILKAYETAIIRAKEADFDAVEVQCGHGYLISQFLSGRTNLRDDEYGKDRSLFLNRVLKIVQRNKGSLTTFVRISASEFVEKGIDPEKNRVILDAAKKYGFDAVHCGLGSSCDTPPWYFSHMAMPQEKQIEVFKKIREMTDLPMIAAGRMADIDKIKMFENENIADFIAFGRPLIADPNLVNKLINKQYDDAVLCGYCLQGCLVNVKSGVGVGCIVNPEVDKRPLEKDRVSKKIAVIGGGPAGMSAAIAFSKKGHNVTLFEKDGKLGGNFILAALTPSKKTMNRPLSGLIKMTEKYVKNIELNSEFTQKDMDKFDYFVVAAGAKQNIPDIENLDKQYWMTSIEYFKGEKNVQGKKVLVIGAGMAGMEAAEELADKGYDVIATKRTDTIANDMEPITKALMMQRLKRKNNIKIMPNTTVLKFAEDSVEYKHEGKDGKWKPFDTIIVASGMNPENELYNTLKEKGKDVDVIGDADKPADIYSATHAGYNLACEKGF